MPAELRVLDVPPDGPCAVVRDADQATPPPPGVVRWIDLQAQDEPTLKRLRNLGYGGGDREANMKAFRQDYEIPDSTSDEDAQKDLENIHDNQLSKHDFKNK